MNITPIARLTQPFVANCTAPAAPKTTESSIPVTVYVPTIPAPNRTAKRNVSLDPASLCLVKKATVTGIIGNTHGVSNANRPAMTARPIKPQKPSLSASSISETSSGGESTANCGILYSVRTVPVPSGTWSENSSVLGGRQMRSLHA